MQKHHLGGVTNTTLHIESDGVMHVEEKQDCEPILNYAAASRNNRFGANICDGMLRHEAEIPQVVYLAECRRIGVVPFSKEGDQAIENIIRDPMYALFRTAPTQRDPRIVMKGVR